MISDYFAFIGVPRKLNLDVAALDDRFRALSRQFHPDFFHNATAVERRASLEQSSRLNDAYRTLKDPASRVAYLLDIEGFATSERSAHGAARASKTIPPALLEVVFEINDDIATAGAARRSGAPEAEWRGPLARARQDVAARRDAHEQRLTELAAAWDALEDAGAPRDERRAVLEALHAEVLARSYIANLVASIEQELAQVEAS